MGFVGKFRPLLGLVATILTVGCVESGDPAAACESMDLGEADPATFVAQAGAPVLALSAQPSPFILQRVCDEADPDHCPVSKIDLPGLTPGSEVVVTSDGRFLVAVDKVSNEVISRQLARDGAPAHESTPISASPSTPRTLVGSLRGVSPNADNPQKGDTNWLIVRDSNGQLRRYKPFDGSAGALLSADSPLVVAALGERYIALRQSLGDNEERLFLLAVDDEERSARRAGPDPIALVRGRRFSQVSFTPGDSQLLATSGTGDGAETVVFAVPNGSLADRFRGGVVGGHTPDTTIPGLRPISPDGSHVAYRTPSGALAMRSLDTRSSCMVRSSTAGDHRLAGFSADGMLYAESNYDASTVQVLAFDPGTRHLAALGQADEGYHLAAVPARSVMDGGVRTPWAIGVTKGRHAALQEEASAEPLGLGDVAFIPRDDEGVWLMETKSDSPPDRTMTVRRVMPRLQAVQRMLEFDIGADGRPNYATDNGELFRQRLVGSQSVCLATGAPGSWGARCGQTNSGSVLSGGVPTSEDPRSNYDDPEPGN